MVYMIYQIEKQKTKYGKYKEKNKNRIARMKEEVVYSLFSI